MLPNDLNEIGSWAKESLDDMRSSAYQQESGMYYRSFRTQGGPRVVIVACLTDLTDIASVTEDLPDLGQKSRRDWAAISVADLVRQSWEEQATVYEPMFDEYGRLSALILAGSTPDGVESIEVLLGLGR